MAEGGRGASRVLAKLKKSIENESFYEAHQMYRTLYFRYCAQAKFDEAIELIYDGATLLLSRHQQTSGADLALLYLEALEKSKVNLTERHIERISSIFALLDNSTPERHQFLVRAIKWSTGETCKLGHPTLHKALAQIWWKEKNYTSARYHYLRSADGSGCGIMLVELQLLKGYHTEIDLFLAQAVLQYLCLQKRSEASDVFDSYTKEHPNIRSQNGPPYLLPLLNFLWLLLLAIDTGKVAHFTVICEQYSPTLRRDPLYNEYLGKIGQVFFNLPAPKGRQSSGFFGNFFEGLLGSLSEEEPRESERIPELD